MKMDFFTLPTVEKACMRTVVACVSPLPKAVSRKNVLKVLPKFSSHLFSTDVFGVKGMTQAEKTKLQMTPVTTSLNQIHLRLREIR